MVWKPPDFNVVLNDYLVIQSRTVPDSTIAPCTLCEKSQFKPSLISPTSYGRCYVAWTLEWDDIYTRVGEVCPCKQSHLNLENVWVQCNLFLILAETHFTQVMNKSPITCQDVLLQSKDSEAQWSQNPEIQ